MPNDCFQFKQFLVKQDKCAMKVCTDACLLGAWTADRVSNEKLIINNVLDIGAGTGLLSLMLAQKLPDTVFDAVEIDEGAAEQARENFDASPWKERLNVYYASIQNFVVEADKKYDVIISNPPFYENDLKSANSKRNLALHSSDLKLEELVSIADKLLNDNGGFFVLLPFNRAEYFEELLAKYKLNVKEKVLVKQSDKHNFFRVMFWIDKNLKSSHQSIINIVDEENDYGNKFKLLLKDYYLKL